MGYERYCGKGGGTSIQSPTPPFLHLWGIDPRGFVEFVESPPLTELASLAQLYTRSDPVVVSM